MQLFWHMSSLLSTGFDEGGLHMQARQSSLARTMLSQHASMHTQSRVLGADLASLGEEGTSNGDAAPSQQEAAAADIDAQISACVLAANHQIPSSINAGLLDLLCSFESAALQLRGSRLSQPAAGEAGVQAAHLEQVLVPMPGEDAAAGSGAADAHADATGPFGAMSDRQLRDFVGGLVYLVASHAHAGQRDIAVAASGLLMHLAAVRVRWIIHASGSLTAEIMSTLAACCAEFGHAKAN